ncbi:MAG: c-type cytochrome [Bacteroidia bacterium]|nr:c-type cytochrome [Bacteroidia bacterium]
MSAFRLTKQFLPLAGFLFILIGGCRVKTPSESEHFRLHPDFEMQLVAAEPMIFDPVDMAFDEKGRAFVLEMPGYPLNDAEGKIILLEDNNSDGKFDKRIVFADSLGVASSLMPYEGGFLVASPPHLLMLKDTDGDSRADFRKILLSGFSYGNLQHNFNGLTYGLDNWIYAANGGNSGNVYWPDSPENKHNIRGNDLRFNLKTATLENVGRSSGGFELAMDDWGNFFGTHNTEHISHIVFPGKYIEGLLLKPTHTLDEISDHSEGELARIYPIGRQDTRVNHPEQSGYFSGSCGITFYGGNVFPEGFNNNIFVADVVLNLIHRDVVHPEGASFTASRQDLQTEFLASTDRSFRPVNMVTGPDGALYLLDMHRKVIEHPEWIPDEIEDTLDLNAGKDAGRIYRITPKGGLSVAKPLFDPQNLEAVVANLAHPNQWQRMTAQRLLVEWQDERAVPLLENFFAATPETLGRLHALWTLEGLGKLNENLLLKALDDSSPGIRANAILLAEKLLPTNENLLNKIILRAEDPDPAVKRQLMLSLSTLPYPMSEKIYPVVLSFAQTQTSDVWIRMATATAGKHFSIRLLSDLLTQNESANGKEELREMLAKQAGLTATETEIGELLVHSSYAATDVGKTRLLEGLAEGIKRRNTPITSTETFTTALNLIEKSEQTPVIRAAWNLRKTLNIPFSANSRRLLANAAEHVRNPQLSVEKRLENLSLLAFSPFAEKESLLYALLNTREPNALQQAAIDQLSEEGTTAVAEKLIQLWPELGPETKNAAGDILLYQETNHPFLLTALESGKINRGEMNFHLERRRALLFSDDESVRKRAEALFTDAGVITRKQALEKMRPALTTPGNAANGKTVFTSTCGTCHRHKGEGSEVGPDLTEIYRKSGQTLLHDILDPNAAADTRYISHTIETIEREIITGIILQETDAEIILRQMNGTDRNIMRKDIQRLTSSGLSLMPEGLENALNIQQMADLLAFLQENPAE